MTVADRRRPALGRGMAALLPNAPPPLPPGRSVLTLPIEAIERSPRQPRKRFDERQLEELAASIREHGVVTPILVRRDGGRYRIVAGERRWRAAQRAGVKEIPALLRDADDRQALELALVENLQRADLNAIEEAEAFEVLTRDHGLTQEAVAERVGKDRSTVANTLRLLKLPAEVRDLLREGRLEMGHARALLALEQHDAMRRAALRALEQRLSVRGTEALVRRLLRREGERRGGRAAEVPALRDLVQRLQRRLGARCRVVPRTAASGRLEVEYTSLEQLDGILARMGA